MWGFLWDAAYAWRGRAALPEAQAVHVAGGDRHMRTSSAQLEVLIRAELARRRREPGWQGRRGRGKLALGEGRQPTSSRLVRGRRKSTEAANRGTASGGDISRDAGATSTSLAGVPR
jgi:hypothetical protein